MSDAWRWTDERGVQRRVSTVELREALASGVLPASTLVWRQGMDAWAPASTLTELADAAKTGGNEEKNGATPGDTAKGSPARGAKKAAASDEWSDLELEIDLVEEAAAAAAGQGGERKKQTPPRQAAREPRPAARVEPSTVVSPGTRKRESMRTLTGLDAPDAAPASMSSVPIVVPSAGGTFDVGVARAITQLPRYDEAKGDAPPTAIPRAPKLPSTDGRGDGMAFDGGRDLGAGRDETKTLVAAGNEAAALRASAQSKAGGARAPTRPPPRPPSRTATQPLAAGTATRENGRTPGSPGQDQAAAAKRPSPAPSNPGHATPGRPLGRSVPPPPVPIRLPALGPRPTAVARVPSVAPPPIAAKSSAGGSAAAPAAKAEPKAAGAALPPAPKAAAPSGDEPKAPRAVAARAVDAPAAANAPQPSPAAKVEHKDPPATGARAGEKAPAQTVAHGGAKEGAAVSARSDLNENAAAAARSDLKESAAAAARETKDTPAAAARSDAKEAVASRESAEPHRPRADAADAGGRIAPSEGRSPSRSWIPAEPAGAAPSKPDARGPDSPQGLGDGSADRPSRSFGAASSLLNTPAPDYSALRLPSRQAQSTPSRWIDALDGGDAGLLAASVQVPLSSLVSAGGALIFMVVVAFFAGRCSTAGRQGVRIETARSALTEARDTVRSAAPAPFKPCWVARQPKQWAKLVEKSVPFDVAATKSGGFLVGYAQSPAEVAAIEIDPATGQVNERFSRKEPANIVSITSGEGDMFRVATDSGGPLSSALNVLGPRPFAIGLANGAVASTEGSDSEVSRLWPVERDEPMEVPRAVVAGDRGYVISFRRNKGIWAGWLGADRKPKGELIQVTGSGGAVGKPSIGWNGNHVAVIFADRPATGQLWEIRAGRSEAGAVPASTQVIPLPSGGPGGDAFAPDITGLADGRWLLVWTEGPPGSRAMRAQTLAPDFSPVGDPIALSPPAGNFGQGILGVSSSYAGVVFLSKPAASYELWGVVLQCG